MSKHITIDKITENEDGSADIEWHMSPELVQGVLSQWLLNTLTESAEAVIKESNQ
jgi:hypothetical protein